MTEKKRVLFWQCDDCWSTPRCEDETKLGDERTCPYCSGQAFAPECDDDEVPDDPDRYNGEGDGR